MREHIGMGQSDVGVAVQVVLHHGRCVAEVLGVDCVRHAAPGIVLAEDAASQRFAAPGPTDVNRAQCRVDFRQAPISIRCQVLSRAYHTARVG